RENAASESGPAYPGPVPKRNRPRQNARRMPVAIPEIQVPRLSPTDRLVGLPAIALLDARTGAPPRLRTALRVGLRGGALCVRYDGRDEGIVATHVRRDAPLWEEDVFEVFLSPGEGAGPLYFEFEVNPLGTLFDARVESPDL